VVEQNDETKKSREGFPSFDDGKTCVLPSMAVSVSSAALVKVAVNNESKQTKERMESLRDPFQGIGGFTNMLAVLGAAL
jgi:hypothetical protein